MLKKYLLPFLLLGFVCTSSCSKFLPKQTVTVGIDTAFFGAPVGNKSGLIHAFILDLFERVFHENSYQVRYHELSFGVSVDALEDKTCDFIVSALPVNFETERLYSFSKMFLALGDVFVTRMEIKDKGLKAFGGKTIAIPPDNTLLPLFKDYPNINLTYYMLVPEVLSKIISYHVDGAFVPYMMLASSLTREEKPYLSISKRMYTSTGFRLVSLKGQHRDVREMFDKGIKEIKKSSSYEELLEKWNLTL